MPYSKQDLQNLYSLSLEDVDATLTACGLSLEQNEYADEQIQSGFDVIRKYFNDAQVSDYGAAAEMFNQLPSPKTKKTGKGKKSGNSLEQESGATTIEDNDLDISQLLTHATQDCGARISLIEAGKILSACGLPDKEQYTGVECEVFIEACTLVKQQGKTYEEVAIHFGIATAPDDSPERQQLLAQVQSRVQSSMLNMSSAQAMQMRQTLAAMSKEQLEAMQIQFYLDLERELREYVESGQMQAEFQAAAEQVIKQPFLTWSPLNEAKNRPLNGGATPKSLPGN